MDRVRCAKNYATTNQVSKSSIKGQTAVEYILLLAAIVGIAVVAKIAMDRYVSESVGLVYHHISSRGWMGTNPSENVALPYSEYYSTSGDTPACMHFILAEGGEGNSC